MTEVVTDERLAAVLRPFVRSTAPVLRAMRESDPLRLRNRFRGDGGPEDEGDLDLAESEPAESDSGEPDSGPSEHGPSEHGKAGSDGPDSGQRESGRARRGEPGSAPAVPGESGPGEPGPVGPDEPSADEPGADELSADEPDPDDPGFVDKLMRRIDAMQLPGSTTWDGMTVDERCDWWVRRIGRLLALITSLPNFGGAITSRLPVRNALGVAGQGLVLSAIAAERGVHDQGDRVRLLAQVLFDRRLSPEVASGEVGGSTAADDVRTEELSGELDAARRERGRPTPKAVIRTVWRMARALWEIDSELDKRPQGRFYHEWLSAVPVVGILGGYLGERSALRRIAKRGAKWVRRDRAGGRSG